MGSVVGFEVDAVPETPALAVSTATLDRNIARMADAAGAGGFALRPHAKTHKCVQVAERQLAAGAVGLTVATIGEAEAFVEAGVTDVFIAYPLWLDGGKRRRVAKLAGSARVLVGLDSVQNARNVVGTGASVVIEVDSGYRRTGVPAGDAGALASAAADLGLEVAGVFTFPGHAMARLEHSTPDRVREHAARDQDTALAAAASSLRTAGIEPRLISGGSTPTAGLWRAEGSLNELRPGVYVFNDALQLALGSCELADVALWAVGTVVSVPAEDRFVLDTGSKVLGADANAWAGGFGLLPAFPGASVVQLSEHHAVVQLPQGATPPAHGDRVALIPNHVCSAVNLADDLFVLSEGRHVDTWRVAARGTNS